MLTEFISRMNAIEAPVILVEGTRSLPTPDRPLVVACGVWLAKTFPHAIFRTGNADGTDTAFAEGIAQIDPTRLQYILPYSGHRKQNITPGSSHWAMTDMPQTVEEQAVQAAVSASPDCAVMMESRKRVPALAAKALYLLRDTVKVIGAAEMKLSPADAGFFFVNQDNPMKGGTGHTVRVCRLLEKPVIIQDQWRLWIK